MVPRLDRVPREEALNVAVVFVLRRDQQSGRAVVESILQSRVVYFQSKAACVAICARTWQCSCAALPTGRAGFFCKVKSCSTGRWRAGRRRDRGEVQGFALETVLMQPDIVGWIKGISCQLS